MTIFQNTLTKFNEKNINAFRGKKKKKVPCKWKQNKTPLYAVFLYILSFELGKTRWGTVGK